MDEQLEFDRIDIGDELPETNLFPYVKSNVSKVESVVVLVIGVFGAVPFGLFGGPLSKTLAVLAFLFAATTAFLVVLVFDLQRSLSSSGSQLRALAASANTQLKQLASRLAKAREDIFESYAYGILMNEGPHTIDDRHHIRRVWSQFDITGSQTVIRERFEGYNYADSKSEYFELRITKDASLGIADMEFEATVDGRTVDSPADPAADRESWKDGTWYAEPHSPFEVTFYVPFAPPLEPRGNGKGSKFVLKYSVCTGETPEEPNYQWIPQHRFDKETEWLQARCISSRGLDTQAVKIKNITGIYSTGAETLDFETERIDTWDEYQVLDEDDRRIHQFEDRNANALYIFKVVPSG